MARHLHLHPPLIRADVAYRQGIALHGGAQFHQDVDLLIKRREGRDVA